jgi:phage tail-like protein
MAQVGQPIEVHTSFFFGIVIDGVNVAAFTECTLPSLQIETFEIKEGGQNAYAHKLPVRVNAGSITLRHGLTKNGELLNWYMQVLRGEIKAATRDISVVMYSFDRKPLMTWVFRNAYPIKWGGPSLKSGDNAVAIEEIELVHHGFELG